MTPQKNSTSLPVTAQHLRGQLAQLQAAFQQAGLREQIDATRFREFNKRRSQNTLLSYRRDLQRLCDLLLPAADDDAGTQLMTHPALWADIDDTVIYAYRARMESAGYAIASINRALYAVRAYAKLAMLSDVLAAHTYAQIADIDGYSTDEAVHIDAKRAHTRRAQVDSQATGKKAAAVTIPADIFAKLMTEHDTTTYVGLRAAVVVRLLAELGLRAGELAGMRWDAVDLDTGKVTFYRQKVHKTQTMRFSRRLLALLRQYMHRYPRGTYLIWKLSPARKPVASDASDNGLSRSGISMVVKRLGRKHGLAKLSAHDLRHHWTTAQHRNGVDSIRLQRMGGWNSPAMLESYIEDVEVTNAGHESPYDV